MEPPSEDDELLPMIDVTLKNPSFEGKTSCRGLRNRPYGGRFYGAKSDPRQAEVLQDIFDEYKK